MESEKLELYHDLVSQPSRAVKALLDAGEIEYENKRLPFAEKAWKEEWFDKMSGGHNHIPFLKVNDDFGISESASQLRYLGTVHAEKLSAGIYPTEL